MDPIHLTVKEEKGDDNNINNEDISIRERGDLPLFSPPKTDQILSPLLVQRFLPKKSEDHTIIDMEVSEEEMNKRETSSSCTLGNFVSKIQPDLMNTQPEQRIPDHSWEFPHLTPEIAKTMMIFGTIGIFISTVIYLDI